MDDTEKEDVIAPARFNAAGEYIGPESLTITCTRPLKLRDGDEPVTSFELTEPNIEQMAAFQNVIAKPGGNEFSAGALLISMNVGPRLLNEKLAAKISTRDFTAAIDFLTGFVPDAASRAQGAPSFDDKGQYIGPESLTIICTRPLKLHANDENVVISFELTEPNIEQMGAFQNVMSKPGGNEFSAGAMLISMNAGQKALTPQLAGKMSTRDFTRAIDFLTGFTPPGPKTIES